jgi:pyruvate dehydrogenase E1 component
MAFVRLLTTLTKDKDIGQRVVPIVPDEARTFGMEGLFRQLGIYSSAGQLYDPADSNQVMFYREDKQGQMLEEGITESGAFSAWLAVATSYSVSNYPMIPFYIYYSMFGFQRIHDLAWAAGDSQARGFLIGATAGRTTLNGEGLQHQDGHSHLLASTIPNCIAYDPTYAYELAVIVMSGLKRMYEDMDSVFYYITTMNENYLQPAMPEGVEEGILKGIYRLEDGGRKEFRPTNLNKSFGENRIRLLGSGTILLEVREAARRLREEYDITVDVWSVTSYNELRREALQVERRNVLNPDNKPIKPFVTDQLGKEKGPIISATDYMKIYSDQLREFMPDNYRVLGTDGFGRSDTREKLRHFFEVDSKYIMLAALTELRDYKVVSSKDIKSFMKSNGISSSKPDPVVT